MTTLDRRTVCVRALALLACLGLHAPSAFCQSYVITDLGALSGDQESKAYAVNGGGQVAGMSMTLGSPTIRAFLNSGGRSADLGSMGGNNTIAYDINSSGVVTGKSRTASGEDHAFRYSGAVMSDLGTLGGTRSYAYGINDAGTVVGQAFTVGGTGHAFLHDGVAMSDLGTLGGDISLAQKINNLDTVVGYATTVGNAATRAFSWTSGGGMVEIGTLGGTNSYAWDINDAGTIVGYAQVAGNTAMHAFLWTSGGGMVDIGTLGGSSSFAYALDENDRIVGASNTAAGASHAFLYDSGVMIDLNATIPAELGWTLERATDITEDGRITGYGTFNGRRRAFVMTPCSGGGDCNGNGLPDGCDIANGASLDCNGNATPDECDIAGATSSDCNGDGFADECVNVVAYFTDFESGVGPEWQRDVSDNTIPNTFTRFTGRFGTDAQTLLLSVQPGQYSLVFDLHIIDSWDGNSTPNGPDRFNVHVNGSRVFRETFTTSGANQTYPGTPDVGPGFYGFSSSWPESIYRNVTIPIAIGGTSLEVTFQGEGLQALSDESWGIDNVRLVALVVDDCNGNLLPDECDIAAGTSNDCNANDVPDDCETDCDGNGVADECDLSGGTLTDCNANGAPDECEVGLSYVPIDFSAYHNARLQDLEPLYPEGDVTLAGIPFSIPEGGNNIWRSDAEGNTNPIFINLETSIYGAREAHTLINTIWGQAGPGVYTVVEFFGSDGAFHREEMVGSDDIRDYFNGSWINGINGTTAFPVVEIGPRRIDKQFIALPADFYDETLELIRMTDNGGTSFHRAFLSGLTVLAGAADCNANVVPDECDVAGGTSVDADSDGTPDECEPDCNANGLPDDYDISTGASEDCNANAVPDECDIDAGTSSDFNVNAVPDECDPDCNFNGYPDDYEIAEMITPDCNANGIPDDCDVDPFKRALLLDGVDDYVEIEVNVSEQAYTASLWFRTSCNNCGIYSVDSGVLGSTGHDRHIYLNGGNLCTRVYNNETICTAGTNYADGAWHQVTHVYGGGSGGQRIYADGSLRASGSKSFSDFTAQTGINIGFSNDGGADFLNGEIDEVRVWTIALTPQQILDNYNRTDTPPSEGALIGRWSFDEDFEEQVVLDAGPLAGVNDGTLGADENENDDDPVRVTSTVPTIPTNDCNTNGVPDECDLAGGTSSDCDGNGVPDECDLPDCNDNDLPDTCDLAGGTSLDCNFDGVPDECVPVDCNANGVPDSCDIAGGTSGDCDFNGLPDECDIAGSHAALAFDGIDDVVQVGDAAIFEVDATLTFEAWIYPTGVGSNPTGGGILLNKEGEYEFSRFPDGTFQYATANASPGWNWRSTGFVAPLDTWSHVALVYDSGTFTAYGNGQLVHTLAGSGLIGDNHPAENDLRIGGRQLGSQFFDGLLDEVRVWNVARTRDEIVADMRRVLTGDEPGLVGYWSFNLESDPQIIRDLTGNGNDGLLGLTAASGLDDPQYMPAASTIEASDCNANGSLDLCDLAGASEDCNANGIPDECDIVGPGGARFFNGSSTFLQNTAPAGLPTGNAARTVEAWILPLKIGGDWWPIVGWGQNTCTALRAALVIAPNGTPGLDGWCNNLQGATVLASNAWQHVAFTYDGAGLARVYLNGQLDGEATLSPLNTSLDASGLLIGRNQDGRTFEGGIDEVRIWDFARDEADILADMNQALTGAEPGLVGYWRLDEFADAQTLFDLTTNGNDLTAGGTAAPAADDPTFMDSAAPLQGDHDCNANAIPDECDILAGTSMDADGDSVPDECATPRVSDELDDRPQPELSPETGAVKRPRPARQTPVGAQDAAPGIGRSDDE